MKKLFILLAIIQVQTLMAQQSVVTIWDLNFLEKVNSKYYVTPLQQGQGIGFSGNEISTSVKRVGRGSLELNGIKYVNFGNPTNLPSGYSPRTMSAWLRTSTTSGVRTAVAYGSSGNHQSMYIGQNGTTLVAGAIGSPLTVSGFWTADTWHFISLTYDGTIARLYADGVEVASATKSWNLVLSKFYFGRNVNDSEYWSGYIDQVKILNSANENYADLAAGTKKITEWDMENSVEANVVTSTAVNSPAFTVHSRVKHYALNLNGTNQYVNVTNESFPTGRDERTITVWAKTNTVASGTPRTIFAYGTAGNNKSMFIGQGQNGTDLIAGAYGSGNYFTVPNFWAVNVWHHLALTYDGKDARLYADGILVDSGTRTSWSLVSSKAYIGRNVNDTEYWNGSIDGLKIFSTWMSAQEIQKNAAAPGPAPSNLSVTQVTHNKINLSWTDNSSNENAFEVKRFLVSGGNNNFAVFQSGTTYSDGQVEEATTYYYLVRAKNDAGYSNFSTEVSATTLPKPPSGLQVLATTSSGVYLTWKDNSLKESGYRIERSTTAGSGYSIVGTVGANVQTFTDNNCSPANTYYYRVAAIAPSGQLSHFCDEESALTLTTAKDTDQNNVMQNFAFVYQYDDKGRMTTKKVPGADPVYMVYDKRDRLVLTQDGNQRAASPKQWTFTKYDQFNRPIATGIKDTTVALTQTDMQGVVNTFYSKAWTSLGETYIGTAAGNLHGYTNKSYPVFTTAALIDPEKYLSVTYYDNYSFKTLWTGNYNYENDNLSNTPAGGSVYTQPAAENLAVLTQVTGTKVKVLDGGTTGGYTWLKSVNYYDDKYRVIQNKSDNYKGGIDRISNLYDFVGKVLQTKSTHIESDVTWKDMVSVQQSGNILTSTSSTSGAASIQQLPAGTNGWLEVIYSEGNTTRFIGLNDSNPDAGSANIDYAFRFTTSNTVNVYENNTLKATVTGVLPGDVFRIERTGTAVKYYRNGIQITLSPASTASSTLLMADASFAAAGSTLVGVRTSFGSTTKTITRTFTYDHAGRLTHTLHQLDGGTNILLAKNEYNELGQLIDKKLHSTLTDASNNKQSVDYRYNIRGWLTSMNDASLTNTTSTTKTNDDATDYFGMNLSYNTIDTDLANTQLYNGNISGIKWSNYGDGTVKQKGYTYAYDAMNRITGSFYKEKTTSWSAPANNGFDERGYQYDLNGNITKLTRFDKRTSGFMDSLAYNYGSGTTLSNRLLSVTDNGDDFKGFIDGNSSGNDYTYDVNGNMTRDLNKGIGTSLSDNVNKITYNYLNLPETVTKGGNTVRYIYDATGRKLAQAVTMGSQTRQTDYAGEFMYENDVLQFINHEEGRIVTSSTKLIYVNAGEAITDFTASNATLAPVTQNGTEKYVKATSNGTVARTGVFPVGGTFSVVAGERYKIRMKGYRTGTSAANLLIKAGGNDLSWPGVAVPLNAATESWIEQIVTIPTGATTLQAGAVWGTVTSGEVLYVNEFEIIKLEITTPEYQYNLKDHLGNVRLTFTSQTTTNTFTAGFETANQSTEAPRFNNYPAGGQINTQAANATSGSNSHLLNGGYAGQVGMTKSFSVMPGDVVSIQATAKYSTPTGTPTNYTNFVASLLGAFGLPTPAVGETGTAAYGIKTFGNWQLGSAGNQNQGDPVKLFVTIILFDRNFNMIDAAYDASTSSGDLMSRSYTVKEPGYAYIYYSNEHPTQVNAYFDNISITHTPSPVIQMDDYYAFGLTFNSYNRENSVANQYLYNGKEKQDELDLGWLDYGARMYNPTIARWNGVDGMAEKYLEFSPYHYAANNPIRNYDIDGNEFTDAAWDWVIDMLNQLGGEVTRLNKRISNTDKKLKEEGISDKRKEKLENKKERISERRDAAQNTYDQAFNEVATMDNSSQVYDVRIDPNVSQAEDQEKAATVYNIQNKRVEFVLGKSNTSMSMFAHEFKHGYQFEAGRISIQVYNGRYLRMKGWLAYDLNDEIEAYERQKKFGSIPNWQPGYVSRERNGVKFPATSNTMASYINSTHAELQNLANSTWSAFRIKNTSYVPNK